MIADKGGDQQISTATRILAEVIASDAAWLVVFNGAIDHIIQSNQEVRQNPRGLHQLDGYKRGDPPLNASHVIMGDDIGERVKNAGRCPMDKRMVEHFILAQKL